MIEDAIYSNNRFVNVEYIDAKIPLTKGTDRQTGLNFDITIGQQDGISGSKLICKFKSKFKELKYLVLILKVILS